MSNTKPDLAPIVASLTDSLQAGLPNSTSVLLTPEHHPQVAALFLDSYLHSEPTTLALLHACKTDREKDLIRQALKDITQWAANELLTHGICVGINDAEGTLVGSILCQDYKRLVDGTPITPPPKLPDPSPVGAVDALLDPLKARYKNHYIIHHPKTLWIANLSVDPRIQNGGLGTKLAQVAVDIARTMGFDEVMCEATGISQECFGKVGLTEMMAVEYGDVSVEGVKVFDEIVAGWKGRRFPVPAARLMVAEL
ncbi:hypothetical protein HK104_009501 [Borealophlyctis nickersoniae]|nr:hypothetical protein HK104_009501 [Borealophlyctis nickersoniae]